MRVNIAARTSPPQMTDDRTTSLEATSDSTTAFNVSTETMTSNCPECGDMVTTSEVNVIQSQGHSDQNRSSLSTGECLRD